MITNNQTGGEKIDYTFQNEVSSSCSSTLNINLTDEKENHFEKHFESLLDSNNKKSNSGYLSDEIIERKDQNNKSQNERGFSVITNFDKDSYENSFSSELERLKSKSTATSTITVKNYEPIDFKDESNCKKNQNINENNQTNTKKQIDKDLSFDEDSSTSTCACSELDSIKTEEYCDTFNQYRNKDGKF